MVVWFENETHTFGVRCERRPTPAIGRRVIWTPPKSLGEVVLLDSEEALLLRPELL